MIIDKLFPPVMLSPDGEGSSGGTGDGNWSDGLPDTVQAWDEVKNSDSPEKFWDQMTNMRSRLGQSIRVPGQDAGDEDWKAFNQKLIDKVPTLMQKPDATDKERMAEVYKAMGKPADAEGYVVPEDLKLVSEEALEGLRKQAFELNLNNEQFANMVKGVEAQLTEKDTKGSELAEANRAGVKAEWGAAYDKHYDAVTKYLEDTGAPKDLVDAAKDKKLPPDAAKWFLSQYEATKGEGSNASGDSSTGDVMTPSEATIQIGEIMNNKSHAYWNPRDPAHKLAMDRMVKLHKYAKGSVT
jgi:hypothetical protein